MASWYEQLRRILITAGAATGRAGSVVFSRFASATVVDGVATVTVGAPTVSASYTTTNATPVDWTIPLTSDRLTVVSYRIAGKVGGADGSAIIREGSKAVIRDNGSTTLALKVGGGGSETFGELGESGVLYANDASSMATANISWVNTTSSGITLRMTGVAGVTIQWTCEAWVREY